MTISVTSPFWGTPPCEEFFREFASVQRDPTSGTMLLVDRARLAVGNDQVQYMGVLKMLEAAYAVGKARGLEEGRTAPNFNPGKFY